MKLPVEPFKEPKDSDGSSSEPESDEPTSPDVTEQASKTPKLRCEVREYEGRINLKGEKVIKAVDLKPEVDAQEKEEGKEYAVNSYRHYLRDGELEEQSTEINSPHIKDALRAVVKGYPGVSLQGETIIIKGELRCVFHYREELEAHRKQLKDPIAKLHIQLILKFMAKQLKDSIKNYRAHVETASVNPSLSFKDLWMGFIPGELVITGQDEAVQLMVLETVNYKCDRDNGKYLSVMGSCLTHDGSHFGYANKIVNIYAFEGTRAIRKLKIFPLRFFDDEKACEKIKQKHIERGRKFCALQGFHHRSYKGVAYTLGKEMDWDDSAPPGAPRYKYRLEVATVYSRIMVDSKTFGESNSANRVWVVERKRIGAKAETELESLTDQDIMICDFQIPGFSLIDKKWCWFSVDFIEPVAFNAQAFKTLLLPKGQKDLVHALVENHGSDNFDDMIKGKGKGLVFVLYGEPGVGKTFTAESVADDIQRPLYTLSSGDLGVKPAAVEVSLSSALKLAAYWGAIVLIDEADVFLEQRTIHDLTRNSLVSLFLRILEYYEGILFLTTNRLATFDVAFKSRIHLALKYSALGKARRKELWKLFIGRASEEPLPESVLDDFSKVDLNGRQIKNAIRTANTLAKSTKSPLGKEHIELVLETIQDFEDNFNSTMDGASTSSSGVENEDI